MITDIKCRLGQLINLYNAHSRDRAWARLNDNVSAYNYYDGLCKARKSEIDFLCHLIGEEYIIDYRVVPNRDDSCYYYYISLVSKNAAVQVCEEDEI